MDAGLLLPFPLHVKQFWILGYVYIYIYIYCHIVSVKYISKQRIAKSKNVQKNVDEYNGARDLDMNE